MRLHALEITAFGPFADTVHVDFDELSDAGLFLLSGATGAGKSSVLDAVCFALYGEVPGDRATAKRLRCDQAPVGVAPRVVLECTLSGRRFRLDRSPAWQRAKRRGTGITTEQARVALSEHVGGEWRPVSTRLDETGHLVTSLVGMNLTQFCQVALLPQGRFQAFLRARSDERHALLQQVFRTGRFDQVERWLRDHRLELRRVSQDHSDRVSDLVSRLSEVAGDPAPGDWLDQPDSVVDWATATRTAIGQAVSTALESLDAAQVGEAGARTEADAARALADAGEAHTRARAELARLDRRTEQHESARSRLALARRAASVIPFHEVWRGAVAREEQAAIVSSRALTRVARLLDPDDVQGDVIDAAALEDVRRRAVAQATEVARLAPLQDEADALAASVAHTESLLDQARNAAERQRAAAALEVARLREAREATCAEHARVQAGLQSAKETWLDLRERRLDGMAAEIAGALVVGGCCPVCGSHDHPAPAAPSPGAPDATAERAARRAVDDAEVTLQAVAEQLRGTEAELAVAETAARQDSPSADVTRLEAQVAHELDKHAERVAQLEAVLGGSGHTSLSALAGHTRAVEEAAQRAVAGLAEHDQAIAATTEARAQAEAAAAEAGFPSLAAAREAALTEAECTRIEGTVHEHAVALERARRQLAESPAPELPDAGLPDLAEVEARLHSAQQRTTAARRQHDALTTRLERVTQIAGDLSAALDEWRPVRDDLELATSLSAFVEGKSPDNLLQMRLSAYVLAHRLSQVVEAANVRLATMSDHRYSLEHSGRRGAGETRGGLSLLVRDDWSGESRDPATLSGGETFVASLSLALGLADVITQEAGGADLDTLFVDEGFGALDADTLEDVMDTLDSLRDGGRVVGVVSHVAEMQTRIPAQLRVSKGREGSLLHQVLG